jgi:hypothetical protein
LFFNFIPKSEVKCRFSLHDILFLISFAEQTGYYRVNYDDETWHDIVRVYPNLSTITRSVYFREQHAVTAVA